MLSPTNVLRLLLKISRKGFAKIETEMALACAIPPNKDGETWRAKNVELGTTCAGNIAPYQPEVLRCATGAGSHTTAVLRLIDYAEGKNVKAPEMEGFDELSMDGFLSKEKILAKCPSLRKPLQSGLEYTLLCYEIVCECPSLMRILSEDDKQRKR